MSHALLTRPYAVLLSCSWVISATYAKITEKVTAKTPDMEITAKYHLYKKTNICRKDQLKKQSIYRVFKSYSQQKKI